LPRRFAPRNDMIATWYQHSPQVLIKALKRIDTNSSIAYATFIFKANSSMAINIVYTVTII